ncbi:SGNH/GDSL hydrolase family protein [Pelagicoccus mobilis]|uniref:SGNH hydrolase-type esterase domain-containing protein n=1 Tax=Pelagicoccus mobilis TaxID=415221 RepID=A0A934RWU5_9BACT|nr:GDSL-type esterase/lipase family protein [Pelagicoccus mobilis]MBK1877798.1 hypothetical protein [Pelagicoccus mobilis]
MKRTRLWFLLGLFFACAASLMAGEIVTPDDSRIVYSGAAYPQLGEEGVELLRFAPDLLDDATPLTHGFNSQKARTTAGVSIRFATNGPVVELVFEDSGTLFSVFRNGVFKNLYRTHEDGRLKILSDELGGIVEYEIVFPLWSNPVFRRLELPEGGSLYSLEQHEGPVVATLGDSITHGRGQTFGNQTWGWVASQAVNAEYYNLSIGGSNANRYQAESLKAIERLDLCAILWGYNDWVNRGKSVDQYASDMHEAIDVVREIHPEAKIVLMSLLNTKTTSSKRTSDRYSAEDFRAAIREIVKSRNDAGDNAVYFVDSQTMTNLDDLRDAVHLSVEGAKKLGDAMGAEFARILNEG